MYTKNRKYAPVGTLVFSDYWRKHYRVLSHNRDGSVTVQWEGGDVVTHRTPFQQGKDRIVPEAQQAQKLDAIALIAASMTGKATAADE
jgi:hypothetical protein